MREAVSLRAAQAGRQIIADGTGPPRHAEPVTVIVVQCDGIGARAEGLRHDVIEIARRQLIELRGEVSDRSLAHAGAHLIDHRNETRNLRSPATGAAEEIPSAS